MCWPIGRGPTPTRAETLVQALAETLVEILAGAPFEAPFEAPANCCSRWPHYSLEPFYLSLRDGYTDIAGDIRLTGCIGVELSWQGHSNLEPAVDLISWSVDKLTYLLGEGE